MDWQLSNWFHETKALPEKWSHSHSCVLQLLTLGLAVGLRPRWELIQLTEVAENKPSKEVDDFLLCGELNCHSEGPVSITASTREGMALRGWE